MNNAFERIRQWLGGLYNPVGAIVKTLVIIIIAAVAVKVGKLIIKNVFKKRKIFKTGIDSKKIDTMATLLTSVYRYSIYIIAAVVILSDVFELKSLLAAAGIGGIAIGLGVQSLIKDVVAGFFIVMEDQYSIGDLITIEGMTGTVEEMEMRVTKIRNFNGDLYIIPNGEIKKVINHSRGTKAVIVDFPLAYSADAQKAFEAASRVCDRVASEFDTIVEVPKVLGITEMGKECMNIRITARALPNQQWEVERRIRFLLKEEFAKQNIKFYNCNEIVIEKPFPGRSDGDA